MTQFLQSSINWLFAIKNSGKKLLDQKCAIRCKHSFLYWFKSVPFVWSSLFSDFMVKRFKLIRRLFWTLQNNFIKILLYLACVKKFTLHKLTSVSLRINKFWKYFFHRISKMIEITKSFSQIQFDIFSMWIKWKVYSLRKQLFEKISR